MTQNGSCEYLLSYQNYGLTWFPLESHNDILKSTLNVPYNRRNHQTHTFYQESKKTGTNHDYFRISTQKIENTKS